MRRIFYDQLDVINPRFLFLLLFLLLASNMMMMAIFGNWTHSLAGRHTLHTILGLILLIVCANTNPRFWFKHAFTFYFIALFLLLLVQLVGSVGMGAQRWLSVGGFQFQPSELMKIALILALARCFQALNPQDYYSLRVYIFPAILIAAPLALILSQPDLGTSILILFIAIAMIVAAGLPNFYILFGAGFGLMATIYLWFEVLFDYQKKRVFSFLDPTSDPAGSGYHLNQSIIAIGSGGFMGKGYGMGTQTQLNFLPEKHTDFIFTVVGEEFGFIGSVVILLCEFSLIYMGIGYSREIVANFPKLVAFSIIALYGIQVCINTAMVLGLLPVVGVPLPIFSYGGTSMLISMIGFGIFFSAMKARHERSFKY
ncbi:MAG: rod shape-determining protein RodA [Alphaproteobacteria bacterium]|nr:rod shape-determining protein RodA [Alphaproteobacteria bacterium]